MSTPAEEHFEEEDFLDELIRERAKINPNFPKMVEAEFRRRKKAYAIADKRARLRRKLPSHYEQSLLRGLAARRAALGLSQEEVAARIGVTQAALAHLERGDTDPKLSTIERYAAALGQKLELRSE
ncbi:MAG TPA: helix-turn-helix transcriptional regulator [Ktedonobacterales bacterium]